MPYLMQTVHKYITVILSEVSRNGAIFPISSYLASFHILIHRRVNSIILITLHSTPHDLLTSLLHSNNLYFLPYSFTFNPFPY